MWTIRVGLEGPRQLLSDAPCVFVEEGGGGQELVSGVSRVLFLGAPKSWLQGPPRAGLGQPKVGLAAPQRMSRGPKSWS